MNATEKKLFPYLLPSVFFISVFASNLILGPTLFNVDGDTGRHLTIGEYILSTGKIPTADIFSQTMAGQPLSPHEWLAEVVFRLFYNWQGLPGIVLLTSLVLAIVFWLLTYRVYQRSGSSTITLILMVVGVIGARIHWLARPHIFTYLFLFLWVELLRWHGSFKVKWCLTVLLYLFWVNTHGAFVTGMAVTGLFMAGEVIDGLRSKDWSAHRQSLLENGMLLLTSLGLSLVNPVGLQIWRTIVDLTGSSYLISHTIECMPPVLYQWKVLPFTVLLGLGYVCIGLRYHQMPSAEVLLILFFSFISLKISRNIPLYILVSLPILAEGYAKLLPNWKTRLDDQFRESQVSADSGSVGERAGALALMCALALVIDLALYLGLPSWKARVVYDPEVFPVRAVDWVQSHPQSGHIFNDFTWGGYILFQIWPEQKVFIDSQTDFYGEALTRDYEMISSVYPGWETLLKKYDIDWCLIPVDSQLAHQLGAESGQWRLLYSDQTAVIYRRFR